jgi:hypothetical protein
MDLFRLFDRSGRGHVFIEDFALGIIEKIHKLRDDSELLMKIADSLLSAESRCIELATLLEKGSSTEPFTKFNIHLKAHAYPIRIQIRAAKTKENLAAMDSKSLLKIFQSILTQTTIDIQHYFHLSNNRMAKVNMKVMDGAKLGKVHFLKCLIK